jgi:hypothetical protein
MQIDPERLREEYDSLSDEALLQIHRADLIEDARRIYDEELAQRHLVPGKIVEKTSPPDATEVGTEFPLDEDHPDWLDGAAEVFAVADLAGSVPAPQAQRVQDVLLAAGIACHLELTEVPQDPDSVDPNRRWRVLVPGQLSLYATSILDRDIYNEDFEDLWKTQLEAFSDKELRDMKPEVVLCGLFDRVERAKKVYSEELARRKLRP